LESLSRLRLRFINEHLWFCAIKGKVKQAAGVLLDDKDMELEGVVQKDVGKLQAGFGDLKEEIKKTN